MKDGKHNITDRYTEAYIKLTSVYLTLNHILWIQLRMRIEIDNQKISLFLFYFFKPKYFGVRIVQALGNAGVGPAGLDLIANKDYCLQVFVSRPGFYISRK